MRSFLYNFLMPDDFSNDAYGWVTNQLGHFVLGLFVTWALNGLGVPVWLGFVGYLGLEAWQLCQGGRWRDGAADSFFVAAGLCWGVWGGSWGLLGVVAVSLIYGALRRI
jgi:hypothetical protein